MPVLQDFKSQCPNFSWFVARQRQRRSDEEVKQSEVICEIGIYAVSRVSIDSTTCSGLEWNGTSSEITINKATDT